MKLNVFLIAVSICSYKYVKQVAGSPSRYKGDEYWCFVLFILKTVGEGTFSPKKREVGKRVEEGCLGRVIYFR